GSLEQVQLLPVAVPVRPDALEAARAVVQRVRHHADVDVVVARELPLEEDPAVGVLGALSHPQLVVGLDAHPAAILRCVLRAASGGRPASAINPLWMATLYDIISELRRENPPPTASKTLDLVVAELGETRDNLRRALDRLEARPVPADGRAVLEELATRAH